MPTPTFTKTGAKATSPAKLDKTVFASVPTNHDLVKLAYDAYLANGRANLAKTKTRGLVRGGGKKPWRQKGTGRARFGSSRVPIWRGGGITFGPTGNENYSKQLNSQSKRLAIRQSLSIAANADKIIVIEDLVSKEGKTAELAKLLAKLESNGKTLIVVEHKTDDLVRASRNLQNVKLVSSNYVNVYDVINADKIIFTNSALGLVTEWLKKGAK